jgi:hypothetical protein
MLPRDMPLLHPTIDSATCPARAPIPAVRPSLRSAAQAAPFKVLQRSTFPRLLQWATATATGTRRGQYLGGKPIRALWIRYSGKVMRAALAIDRDAMTFPPPTRARPCRRRHEGLTVVIHF